ncbi:MAG TPA: SPW repeat protein [Ramlibacter sp.]|nr:SPW repeat protein [Ramlibacter sp.]
MKMKHWQDPINALLGIWLIISPWVLGFSSETAAMANFVIVGILLLAAALGAMYVPKAWEEWTESVLGLWMIISPWIVRYTTVHSARTDAVVVGIVVLILGFWAAAQEMGWQGENARFIRH